jgi:hypothetical protein
MSALRTRIAAAALFAGLGSLISCAVGPGYGGGDGYVEGGYVGGYYDPCCYGGGGGGWGWGGHYHVAPPRGGPHPGFGGAPRPGGGPGHGEPAHGDPGHGGGGHGGGRPAPSIPGRPR